jgi:ubiquinone/menaquinone biosynthesis C-methylase UbiE
MNPTFSDHFSSVARGYADFRPRYPAALFDYLATQVTADAVVWDCAAGSGQATVDLARRFGRVIATDASAEQVASAPQLSGVEWRVALAEQSGLPDASVGLVTVAQAIHWFSLDRFYAEVRRVLVPGGLIAIWAYGKKRIDEEPIHRLVDQYYSVTVGPYWPPERRLIEEGYRTIPFPFEQLPAPTLHMEAEWSLDELMGYLGTWSATSRYRRDRGTNPLESLRKDLAPLWGDSRSRRRVQWPLALRVGRV